MNTMQRYIIAAVVTAIAIFILWYFGDVLSYILASVVFSLIGTPLADMLCRIKVGRFKVAESLTAAVSVCVMWGVIVVLATLFIPILMNKLDALSAYNYSDLESAIAVPIANLEGFIDSKLSINLASEGLGIMDTIHLRLSELVSDSVTSIDTLLGKITSLVIAAFSITFITFFFLKERNLFNQGVVLLFPGKYEENILRGLDSSVSLLSRYFIGLCVESFIKLVVMAVVIYLIGFPFNDSLVIALISAVLNVIPYIGPLLGVAIGVIIGLTSAVEPGAINGMIVAMVIAFAIFQTIDNIVLQPYVYSSSVKAHPLEIFLVILMAGSMAGVVGMLLAIPAYTIIRVFAKEFFYNLRLVQKLTENI